MAFYNDRPEYSAKDATQGVRGELLVFRYDLEYYKNDSNIIVHYVHKLEDSKTVGDLLIYDIKNDFLLIKEVECRSNKDFAPHLKYYLSAYNLMTPEMRIKFSNTKLYPTGINIPDKCFNMLCDNIYKIPNPDDPNNFIVNRKLTKKEIRSAMYVIVNDDETCFEFPKNMIEVPIYKILNSTIGFCDNIRQKNEPFYKVGYTVADYITIKEDTNEKYYHAD